MTDPSVEGSSDPYDGANIDFCYGIKCFLSWKNKNSFINLTLKFKIYLLLLKLLGAFP